jgi:hypothetical protein
MKCKVLLSLSLLALATVAVAGTEGAGTKGHVSGYDFDQTTVIHVAACARKKLTWDYIGCGKDFREKTNERLCRERGKGKHKWFYQVGDSKVKTTQTAFCK